MPHRVPSLTDSRVEKRWRALWETSPQRSSFSRLDYVDAVARSAGLRTAVHFTSADGRDTAGAAVTWRRRGPYREVVVPPFTPFSALLLSTPLSEADVHLRSTPFEDILGVLESSYHAVRLHLHPSLTDARGAQWRGWSVEPLYTYRLNRDGRSLEEWSSSATRNFRRGRDAYETVGGREAASAAVRLAADAYARHERTIPLAPPSLENLAEEMDGLGLSRAFAARRRDDGVIDAGVIILLSDESAYYWIAGSRPGDGMTVLIGDMLPQLFDSGVTVFDFVGANTPGIAEFKRRFGADLVQYFRLVHFSRVDLRLLHVLRNILR